MQPQTNANYTAKRCLQKIIHQKFNLSFRITYGNVSEEAKAADILVAKKKIQSSNVMFIPSKELDLSAVVINVQNKYCSKQLANKQNTNDKSKKT